MHHCESQLFAMVSAGCTYRMLAILISGEHGYCPVILYLLKPVGLMLPAFRPLLPQCCDVTMGLSTLGRGRESASTANPSRDTISPPLYPEDWSKIKHVIWRHETPNWGWTKGDTTTFRRGLGSIKRALPRKDSSLCRRGARPKS